MRVEISVIFIPRDFFMMSGLLVLVYSMNAVRGFLGALGSLVFFLLLEVFPPFFSLAALSLFALFTVLVVLDLLATGVDTSSLLSSTTGRLDTCPLANKQPKIRLQLVGRK